LCSLARCHRADQRAWKFLDPVSRKKFDRATNKAPSALFVGTGGSIKWKECRDYLELRKAILVQRGGVDQRIAAGPQFSLVKAEFPGAVKDVVELALIALRKLQALRQNAAGATKKQQKLLAAFKQHAQAVGLGVA
jgi:hypothetical protein